MLEKVLETCKRLSDSSLYVTINEDRIKKVAKKLEGLEFKHWIVKTNNRLLKLPIEDQVNFLLIFDSIDFSFWGNPKWTVELKSGKKEDGAYALMESLLEYFEDTKNLDFTKVSFEEFKDILKGNVEIPLLEERYNCLVKMNKYLDSIAKDFYNEIKDYKDDISLLDYIINSFDYFNDECDYKGERIYFYKRAQLITSDILHVRKLLEDVEVNYTNLMGCADYKIPQVMRCLEMIEFNDELASMVDNYQELSYGSEMEVEIRANNLVVIDYIYKKMEGKVSRMDINDYIWLLGQDKSKMVKPYHRTKTIYY